MTTEMMLNERNDELTVLRHLQERGWSKCSLGALVGLLGGVISPLFGSLLTAVGWITGPTWHGLAIQRTGTFLLFLTIPLLLFGAHCLDLVDKNAKQERKEDRVKNSENSN